MSKLNLIKTENLSKLGEYLETNTVGSKISEIALTLIALGIASGVAILAIGLGNAIQIFDTKEYGRKYSKKQRVSVLNSLHKQRLITNSNGKISLTNKGDDALLRFRLRHLKIKKPNKWDGHWRVIIFDIPTKNKKSRDALRFALKRLGFIQFQKSVWINPFPCQNEINFIAEYFKVSKYIELMVVKSITSETKFKKAFHLV